MCQVQVPSSKMLGSLGFPRGQVMQVQTVQHTQRICLSIFEEVCKLPRQTVCEVGVCVHMGESLPGASVPDRLPRTRGLGEGRLAPRTREPGGTKRG